MPEPESWHQFDPGWSQLQFIHTETLTRLVSKPGDQEKTTCGIRTVSPGSGSSLSPQLSQGNHQYQCQNVSLFGQAGWPSWGIPGCMTSSPGLIRVGKDKEMLKRFLLKFCSTQASEVTFCRSSIEANCMHLCYHPFCASLSPDWCSLFLLQCF